jgi:hypothetical protein
MVVCQPGSSEVAKSMDTMVCTESTSGVDIPASIKQTVSKRCHVFTEPVQPKEQTEYILRRMPVARSRIVARSGNNPVYQNTNDTEKYVDIANTSQTSGELKLTQIEPNWFGKGKGQ